MNPLLRVSHAAAGLMVAGHAIYLLGSFALLHCILLRSDFLFKLLLIGDSGVGKSCLLLRFGKYNVQVEHCLNRPVPKSGRHIMYQVLIIFICLILPVQPTTRTLSLILVLLVWTLKSEQLN